MATPGDEDRFAFDSNGLDDEVEMPLWTLAAVSSGPGIFDSHADFMTGLSNAFENVDYDSVRKRVPSYPVEKLPTPVLLNILHCVPNTNALYDLIRASKPFNGLFTQYKTNILYSVLWSEIPKPTQAFECLKVMRSLSPRALGWLRRTRFVDIPSTLLDRRERMRLHPSEAKYLRERATWDTFSWRELTLYLSSLKFRHGSNELDAPIVDIRKIFHQPLPVHYYMASAPTAHYDYRETFRMRIGFWIDEDLNSDDWWRKDYWKRISMGGCMFGGYKAWERRRGYADGWLTRDFIERNGLLEEEILVDKGEGPPEMELVLYRPPEPAGA